MDAVLSSMGGGLLGVGKNLFGFIYPKFKSIIRFKSNLEKLNKEMGNLTNLQNNVKGQIEAAERSGHMVAPAVTKWLGELEDIKNDVNSIEASMESNRKNKGVRCPTPSCCFPCTLGVEKSLIEVKRLIEAASFPSGMVVENYQLKKVEHIPGPSITGQSTAYENLMKVMNLLNDDVAGGSGASRIGVWGMGGVGKTTLVNNLNNKLETAPAAAQPFSIIIWVTVSKEFNLERLQTQLLNRLNLEVKAGESMKSTASRLHERLKMEKRFLLILDDVWEAIDLDDLGVPQPQSQSEFCMGNKIILTTRSLDVCRQMKTDIDVKVDVLNEEESWQLFTQNAGMVASLPCIQPIARKVSRECSGLPLAIIVVGASMRGKTTEALWKDALYALQRSVPRIKGIENKVYRPLKWSYDSLFFQGMDIKSCFLYCSLYPEDCSIEVNELVQCWIAEGLVGEVQNYEDSLNRGIALVENLKDSCLLEKGANIDTVKMHDVVRDVALWIASSSKDGCNNRSLVQSGTGLNQISEGTLSESFKRVSFMHNNIRALPDSTIKFPMVSSLLLQHNFPLQTVPEGFLLGFQALNVLNLSETRIRTLPLSLLQLSKLRALILRRCWYLKKLPPVGNLRLLEVLDCSFTDLELLPEGIENLTNLRLLDLSVTRLTFIPNGIISQLSNLEIVDMTNSFYTWDTMGDVGSGRTPFDELQCLERLSALFINLNCYNLAFNDVSWIERLKRFHILIGPTNAKAAEVKWSGRATHYEKRMKWLVKDSNLEKMPKNLPEKYHFSGLKSLTIADCDLKFQPARVIGPEIDLLPNLEELTLRRAILESISELVHHLHLRFSRLRIIKVFNCNRLKYLFSSTCFVPTLENLEFVTVGSCEAFVELFENASSSQSSEKLLEELVEHATSSQTLVPNCFAPNLRIMKLENLPKLTTMCGKHQSWHHLEKLEVINCNLIKKLPFNIQNANTIKEITGKLQWWNHLEWDDEDTESSLQQYFIPC
ncbi:unnamed protein product [Camellia sinensis]